MVQKIYIFAVKCYLNGERRSGNRKMKNGNKQRIGNEVTYRTRIQVTGRNCSQIIIFFIFPIPVLVPRSPLPFPHFSNIRSWRGKVLKFKRKIKMRSQGKRCALYFRQNFVTVSIESQRTESKVTIWPIKGTQIAVNQTKMCSGVQLGKALVRTW